MTLRQRCFEILEVASAGDPASRLFDLAMITLIIANVLAVILGTVGSIQARYGTFLYAFEVFSVAVFTVEYLLRVWSCSVDPRYAHGLRGRLRFAARPLLVIDLLAILPFYLAFLAVDLRVLRAFRLFRLVRIAKLARYSRSLQALGRVMWLKKEELVLTVFALFVLLIVASTLVYYAEREAQPEVFSSVPAAMWWGVATLTTVGYGDVYPVTWLGKAMAAVVAVLGIGMFALPAGILGSGFMEALQERAEAPRRCPHCGEPLE